MNLTICQQLFQTPFLVKVPSIYLYSEEYDREMGRLVSGNPLVDKMSIMEQRPIYRTIVQIVELFVQGAPLKLGSAEDALTIYKLVREHLENWTVVSKMLNAPEPPMDDLKAMDEFAEAIYPMATRYMNDPHSNIELKLVQRTGKVRIGFKRRQVTDKPQKEYTEQVIVPKYVSVTDQISQRDLFGQ